MGGFGVCKILSISLLVFFLLVYSIFELVRKIFFLLLVSFEVLCLIDVVEVWKMVCLFIDLFVYFFF